MRSLKKLSKKAGAKAEGQDWRGLLRQPANLFLIIALFFGLIFVIKTPPLWGGDETTHYARAYQISRGDFVADKMPYPFGGISYGGRIPSAAYDLIWHTNDDIVNDRALSSYGTHRVDNIHSYKTYTHQKLGAPDTDYFFPNTAAYSPVAYIPSAIGLGVAQTLNFNVGQSIFIARLFGLLFYIACVYWALKSLKRGRYAWLVFAVALIPTAIFQASIIGADVTANALAILLTAFVVKSIATKMLTRRELYAVAAAAIALPLIKPTYIFVSMITLLIPAEAFGKLAKFKPLIMKLAVLFIALIGVELWAHATAGVSEEIRRMGIGPRWTQINPTDQTHFITHHPTAIFTAFFRSILMTDNTYIGGVFGQFGFDFIQVPMMSILASLTAIFMALGIAEKIPIGRRKFLLALAILLGGIASVFGALYITFSNVAEPIIEGVQGRYFIPLVLFALTLVVFCNDKVKLQINNQNRQWIYSSIAVLCSFSLLAATVKFFYVMLG